MNIFLFSGAFFSTFWFKSRGRAGFKSSYIRSDYYLSVELLCLGKSILEWFLFLESNKAKTSRLI